MILKIDDSELTEDNLPPPEAKWEDIWEFALTFNGYKYSDKCADIANNAYSKYNEAKQLPDDLSDLRSCLFFEQRRWRHFGKNPDEQTMDYIHALIESIRNQVLTREK
jgi:hypothetical protein